MITVKSLRPFILLALAAVPALIINSVGRVNGRSSPAVCKDCNIIWISIDTLGSKHLPCYGYERDTAPNLCRFAGNNILFKNAYTNSYWTLPSSVTEFTGLLPETHQVLFTKSYLNSDSPTLQEILHRNGYTTIMGTPPDDPAVPIRKAFSKGVDTYMYEYPWDDLLKLFEGNVRQGKKTFIYIHNYSVHSPYLTEDRPKLYTKDNIPEIPSKAEEVYRKFSPEYFKYMYDQLPKDIRDADYDTHNYSDLLSFMSKYMNDHPKMEEYYKKMLDSGFYPLHWQYLERFNWERRIKVSDPRHIEYIKALYDQKIHELDDKDFSKLFDFYNRPEIKDKTILIISSEHGEEFMEHGYITHLTTYNANARVPLIMSIPRVGKKQIKDPVQLADLTPTILDMVGLKSSDFKFQGNSLDGLLTGRRLDPRPIVIQSDKMAEKAIVWKNRKLFVKAENGSITPLELYDLDNDLDEKNNILLTHYDEATKIIEEYKKWQEDWYRTYQNDTPEK